MLPPTSAQEHLAPHVPQPHNPPALLTIKEFYEALGQSVGINTIRAGVKSSRIRSVTIGRKSLIPRSELVDWIAREMDGKS